MATMKEQAGWFLDRFERQAKRMVRLELEMERLEKLAAVWEARALKAEAQQQQKCEKLETRLAGAEYLIQRVLLGEDVRNGAELWINAPFVEEQREQAKVAVNGTR